MTGHHRDPKQKLQTGYRAPSLKQTSRCDAFTSSSVVSRTFSALCMYSTFRHHSHPWVTFVPNLVSFEGSIAELAHGEKSCIQSINHTIILSPSLFDAPGTVSLRKTNLM